MTRQLRASFVFLLTLALCAVSPARAEREIPVSPFLQAYLDVIASAAAPLENPVFAPETEDAEGIQLRILGGALNAWLLPDSEGIRRTETEVSINEQGLAALCGELFALGRTPDFPPEDLDGLRFEDGWLFFPAQPETQARRVEVLYSEEIDDGRHLFYGTVYPAQSDEPLYTITLIFAPNSGPAGYALSAFWTDPLSDMEEDASLEYLYTNGRFAYSANYHPRFEPMAVPDNGDGITLYIPETEIKLMVYASHNLFETTREETAQEFFTLYQAEAQFFDEYSFEVTYPENEGTQVYLYEMVTPDLIVSMRLIYPQNAKDIDMYIESLQLVLDGYPLEPKP